MKLYEMVMVICMKMAEICMKISRELYKMLPNLYVFVLQFVCVLAALRIYAQVRLPIGAAKRSWELRPAAVKELYFTGAASRIGRTYVRRSWV